MERTCMSEIKCPECGKFFKVDETSYSNILKQVHDKEFEISVNRKMKDLDEKKKLSFEIQQNRMENDYKDKIRTLEKANLARLQKLEEEKNNRDQIDEKRKLSFEIEKNKIENSYKEKIQNLEKSNIRQIQELEREKQTRDQVIDRLKNMQSQLSTKMVGESLEQHCEIEFNKIRATAFPQAYFEKDNDASSGSKGDYIFREYDDKENEIVSIMFEMKNETDTTASKKKNEDFLKELDKDRNEKKCEYAVLVSQLEADNDLFNCGIVDMSHKYPQMYVIRPSFFVPIISLLRNASMKSLEVKRELSLMREQNIDVANFEYELDDFKKAFGRNYNLAQKKFSIAIDQIDKSIRSLEKTKEELLNSENQFRLANNKAQEVSIKKLTKKSPTMAKKFKETK
tara:strand:- start:7 stop:1200 length:1194 start_codon:yes stop_codon:yes gene_type:complete